MAIVTNIGSGDHLGLADIATTEQLAKVKRTIVDVVAADGTAVLNAGDPLVVAMAEYCPGKILFFAIDENTPVLAEHRSKGGGVAFVRDETIILSQGPNEVVVGSINDVPITHQGRVPFQVENTLAATAAAWCLGVPIETIRDGLVSFRGDMRQAPGRFNVLHALDSTFILDYGHNPSAVEALVGAINQFPHERRVAVFSAAGDRRDEDIVRQGELIGAAFDRVILFEDQCNRGRADGTVVALLRQGVETGGRVQEIVETRGERIAIEIAFRDFRPGDLVHMQVDDLDNSPGFVQHLIAELLNRSEEEKLLGKTTEPIDSPANLETCPARIARTQPRGRSFKADRSSTRGRRSPQSFSGLSSASSRIRSPAFRPRMFATMSSNASARRVFFAFFARIGFFGLLCAALGMSRSSESRAWTARR